MGGACSVIVMVADEGLLAAALELFIASPLLVEILLASEEVFPAMALLL